MWASIASEPHQTRQAGDECPGREVDHFAAEAKPIPATVVSFFAVSRPIMKDWNYTVRFYRPRKEILDGI